MNQPISNVDTIGVSRTASRVSLAASVGALVSLGSLHLLSPEFDPSWRVVSEYALGRYGWVLSLMFLMWALSSWAVAFTIRPEVKTIGGQIGLLFLVAAGFGEAMAAVFDIQRPGPHALAGAIGVPSLPIAAILVSVSLGWKQAWLRARKALLLAASLTWISLALMGAAMLSLRRRTGGSKLLIGWPSRLLIVIYLIWTMTVVWHAIRLERASAAPAPR